MSIVLARKKLNDKTETLVGKDAGPSHSAHEEAYLRHINECREKAKTAYLRAIYAHMFRKNKEARGHIDRALQAISEAFWCAEGTKIEESQHELLHEIAKWKHDSLGCYLIKSGNNYINRCSIVITHKRLGFSIGFTADSVCALCNKDEFECEHSSSRTYWVKGGLNDKNVCNACGEGDCLEHSEEYIYKICPSRRLANPVLYEVSMVRRPAVPTARLTEIPVSRKEIEAALGPIDESAGMVYACHACGGNCPGFIEFPDHRRGKPISDLLIRNNW